MSRPHGFENKNNNCSYYNKHKKIEKNYAGGRYGFSGWPVELIITAIAPGAIKKYWGERTSPICPFLFRNRTAVTFRAIFNHYFVFLGIDNLHIKDSIIYEYIKCNKK